jgi:hypothetical protein
MSSRIEQLSDQGGTARSRTGGTNRALRKLTSQLSLNLAKRPPFKETAEYPEFTGSNRAQEKGASPYWGTLDETVHPITLKPPSSSVQAGEPFGHRYWAC